MTDIDEEIRRARSPQPKLPRRGVRWKTFHEIHEAKPAIAQPAIIAQPPVLAGVARAIGADKR
jgi:hypothetical protein